MENQWTIPPTDPQRRHGVQNYACCIFKGSLQFLIIQTPPTVERLGPTFQPNMPTYQQGEDATTQNCTCPWCSEVERTQDRPTTWYPVEQQDPRHFGVSSFYGDSSIPPLIASLFKNADTPYLNQYQNVDNCVPDRTGAPQTAVRANISPHILIVEVLT